MLYVLTGGIQTGKTRWIERLIGDLESRGVSCLGVISPGIWREWRTEDGGAEYEKLGIESVLLPDGTRDVFARRRDLAEEADGVEVWWQSSQAMLGWAIPDEAIASVNRHFDTLGARVDAGAPSLSPAATEPPGLLVVDELGRLELEKECGFIAAVRLLERGPTRLYRHALVVARDWLAEMVLTRFAVAWGQTQRITADEEARRRIAAVVLGKNGNSGRF
jgi:nucleoside-triphosphatase THEP1